MHRRDFCKLLTATALASPLARMPGRAFNPESAEATGLASLPAEGRGATGTLPKVRMHPEWRGLATGDNTPFIPFGAAYFRPNTGWAPQVWKQFDAAATARDFDALKANHCNTARIFLASTAFYPKPGALDSQALQKLDTLIALAEAAGIYLQICGLGGWEGTPAWQRTDVFADPRALEDQEQFWSLIAGRYKGRGVIFAYELANEPVVNWNTPEMQAGWNKWNHKPTPIPPPKDNPGDSALLYFQHFREHIADEWTRRQVAAIKKADAVALVTIGLIQNSIPVIPNPPYVYSGFRPQRQAKFLDFMEIHFYPLAAGGYWYQSEAIKLANLAYLESLVRETAFPGLPTVLGEFGWFGGGICPNFGPPRPATQQQQADFCAQELRTTTPLACGWLNWAMFDDPEATDVTRFSGLFTADGKEKLWGKRFAEISVEYRKNLPPVPLGRIGPRPSLPWDACLTNSAAAEKFRVEYLKAFEREEFRT